MALRVLLGLSVLVFISGGCSEFQYGGQEMRHRASAPPPRVYTVRRGDTLFSVAWRYGLDHRKIARWNGIDPPYTIYPEQRLRLHPRAVSKRKAATNEPRAGKAGAKPQALSKANPPAPEPIPEPEPAVTGSGPAVSKPRPVADSKIVWRWPAEGTVSRHFRSEGSAMQGITLQGELNEPIRAAAAGHVVYSGSGLRGYGNLIIVKHNSAFITAYGYNRELLVQEGDEVSAGQVIARMGLGPAHRPAAHFEIRRNGQPVDPLEYLPAH